MKRHTYCWRNDDLQQCLQLRRTLRDTLAIPDGLDSYQRLRIKRKILTTWSWKWCLVASTNMSSLLEDLIEANQTLETLFQNNIDSSPALHRPLLMDGFVLEQL